MPETIVLDPELAARADALFRELGLDLSTAIQLFLKQSLREHGLPFTPRLTPPAPVRPTTHLSPPKADAPSPGRNRPKPAPVKIRNQPKSPSARRKMIRT